MRNFVQSFIVAIGMLRLHKLRAFLTMLGVIIGVMSVTMIVMISSGFQAYINGEFKKLGSDTMFVFFDPGRRDRGQNLGSIANESCSESGHCLWDDEYPLAEGFEWREIS